MGRQTRAQSVPRILENPDGDSSPEKSSRARSTRRNVGRRHGGTAERKTDGDEYHQDGGPRIGQLCSLLRLHAYLLDPPPLQRGSWNRLPLPAVLGVLLQQSLSEPVHLRHPVRGRQALVEGHHLSRGSRSARRGSVRDARRARRNRKAAEQQQVSCDHEESIERLC